MDDGLDLSSIVEKGVDIALYKSTLYEFYNGLSAFENSININEVAIEVHLFPEDPFKINQGDEIYLFTHLQIKNFKENLVVPEASFTVSELKIERSYTIRDHTPTVYLNPKIEKYYNSLDLRKNIYLVKKDDLHRLLGIDNTN